MKKSKKTFEGSNLMSDDEALNPAAIAELAELSKWPFVEIDFAQEFMSLAQDFSREKWKKSGVQGKLKTLSYV